MRTINEFVAIDLEITGLDFQTDTIIEVALAKFENGKVTESYNKLINPNRNISTFIHNLTGIYQDELNEASIFAKEAMDIRNFIGEYPVVAHNSKVDFFFLNKCLKEVNVQQVEENLIFDSLLASRVAWPQLVNHRLDTLVRAFDIQVEDSHRALPDAIACGEIFIKALETFKTFSEPVQVNLARLCRHLQSQDQSSWKYLFDHEDNEELELINPNLNNEKKQNNLGTLEEDLLSENESLRSTVQKIQSNLNNKTAFVNEIQDDFLRQQSAFLAAALVAHESGERVIIGTSIEARNELIHNVIPELEKKYHFSMDYCTLRNREHYLCLNKLQFAIAHASEFLVDDEILTVLTVIPWAYNTQTGDINENKGFNIRRNKQLWYKLSATPTSSYSQNDLSLSFAHKAREKAKASKLVFIDLDTFYLNMQMDFSLLPEFSKIILDDAHRLIPIGNRFIGRNLWFFRFKNLAQVFCHQNAAEVGLYGVVRNVFSEDESILELTSNVKGMLKSSEKKFHRYLLKLGKNCQKKLTEKNNKIAYTGSLGLEFNAQPEDVLNEMNGLLQNLQNLIQEVESKYPGFIGLQILKGLYSDANDVVRDLVFFCDGNKEEFLFWLEDFNNPHKFKFHATPLKQNFHLKHHFYPKIKSIALLSNEISVFNHFNLFKDRMGLFGLRNMQVKTEIHNDNFAFLEKKRFSAIPVKNPNNEEVYKIFTEALETFQGRIILHFNNPHAILLFHKYCEQQKVEWDRKVFFEGVDCTIDNMRPLVNNTPNGAFVINSSFGKTINIESDDPLLVIVSRVTFPEKKHPVVENAVNHLKVKNQNPFKEYLVPHSVWELKGFLNNFIHMENSIDFLMVDDKFTREKYSMVYQSVWKGECTEISSVKEIV